MTCKILLALVCGMLLVASTAWYTPAWEATVSGTVTDAEGEAVVGLIVLGVKKLLAFLWIMNYPP